MRNNLPMALVAGATAAIVSAVIWAAITVSTGYQIGWIAVGVGILVGFAVRLAGKGETIAFAITGAAFALIGCLLGNFLAGIGFISQELEMGYFEALGSFDFAETGSLMGAMFSPIDLLFYGIAVWEGFKFGPVEGVEVMGGEEA
ncbi:MAG: hypothetical protein AAGI48_04460 [Verrucomicrobiota bacterium]